VREETLPLAELEGLPVRDLAVVLLHELRDGARDGVVQATIEGPEFVDADRKAAFERQIRHRLADIAVVVHDLIHSEAMSQQLAAVQRGHLFQCG